MSRVTPPAPGAGSGQPNPQRPTAPQASAPAPAPAPGTAANKPNVTPPKAPSVGASAPPTAGGRPANQVPPRPAGSPLPGGPKSGLPGGASTSKPGVSGGGAAAAGSGMPPIDQLQGRPIGRVLTKMGKVTREQVVEALTFQKSKGGALGRILIDLGYIKEVDLNTALAAQRGYELVNLDGVTIPADAISAVPAQIATTNKVLPVAFDKASKKLTVVMASHENFRALDDLRSLMGYSVTAKIGDPDQIERLIQKHYNTAAESIGDILGDIQNDETLKDLGKRGGESIDLNSLKEAADSNPVRKLINLVLLQAIKDKASDIHFEPFEDEFKMRYRIDGVLYEMMPPPNHIAPAISSRVKVMANLDIAERRMPQDGRIELNVNNQPIDLRVSVLPTMFGESVVMRVLDRSNVALDLDKIGLREDDLVIVRQLIAKPNGVVLVTGPTGSGKTTTLYSALRELNDISSKLITAEDPVEYDIDGIIQCQIKPEIELTFARILRSMLRQDPDIVLVGEIRDNETAKIAIEASLTGHLVFSTLHTNDAPSSVARLLDLGLEPFLVTAALEGVVAQRLVRKICVNCKSAYSPTEEQLMELELRPDDVVGKTFYYGKGCENCNNTGYRGRMGIYEIMLLDDDMRDQIIKHASTQVLRAEARKRGMRTLRTSGLLAIYDGITSIEEVVRETIMEEG
ncbi:MAG: type pilus assembly protein PilB [Phycisphaerales bacterium]|jgi:type IV pilus assembly protein PilB|nr:type pilus assembly protein PilB [Phycisphaerales bacterium]